MTESSNDMSKMKPFYMIDNGIHFIKYGETGPSFALDESDWKKCRSFNKPFKLIENQTYPCYKCNNNTFTLLEFIFNFNPEENVYVFKNSNRFDLQKNNVTIYHSAYEKLNKNEITGYIQGHHSTLGQNAYKIQNPIWKIKDEKTESEYMLMYCGNDVFTKICENSYNAILEFEKTKLEGKKIKWSVCVSQTGKRTIIRGSNHLAIHQVILNCYGNYKDWKGLDTVSVDHINRDPLDNRICNLRVATLKEQMQNTNGVILGTKRDRKWNARQLPDGIEQSMLRKYVVYYSEIYDQKSGKMREFFKVEKHPKLQKPWMSSKSGKVSTLEKLEQANKVVDNLENDSYPSDVAEDASILPKCIYVYEFRNKPHLVFDMRKEGSDNRLSLRMVLPAEYNLQDELERFREKIIAKYGDGII
jgi:hypothetical protein